MFLSQALFRGQISVYDSDVLQSSTLCLRPDAISKSSFHSVRCRGCSRFDSSVHAAAGEQGKREHHLRKTFFARDRSRQSRITKSNSCFHRPSSRIDVLCLILSIWSNPELNFQPELLLPIFICGLSFHIADIFKHLMSISS